MKNLTIDTELLTLGFESFEYSDSTHYSNGKCELNLIYNKDGLFLNTSSGSIICLVNLEIVKLLVAQNTPLTELEEIWRKYDNTEPTSNGYNTNLLFFINNYGEKVISVDTTSVTLLINNEPKTFNL